ncbi:hypothetical protein pb186bvf_014067 [Paramecium bursaria]
MGVCSAKKQKENLTLTTLICITQREETQQNKVPERKGTTIKQDMNQSTTLNKEKFQLIRQNPFKYYTVLPKDCQIKEQFKMYFVQHNISGQLRANMIIDQNNEAGYQMYKKLKYQVMNHPNISRIYEIYKFQKQYHLIFELCMGGNITQEKQDKFSEQQIALILMQIIQAILYIHKQNLFHGKITLESFQFVNDSDDLNIKLCDIYNIYNDKEPDHNQCLYIAPESCHQYHVQPQQTSDIWAIGIIFYKLLSGSFPFEKQAFLQKYIHQLKRGQISYELQQFDNKSKTAISLLKRLLCFDPKKRITITQILEDPYFKICESSRINSVKSQLGTFCKTHIKPNELQLSILKYMLKQFGTENQQNIYNTFQVFDINRDGRLNKKEIVEIYKQVFPELNPEEEAENIFNKADYDKSGDIDFDEFVLASIDRSCLITKINLEMLFKMFDVTKQGKVTSKRFSEVLQMDEKTTFKIITSFNKQVNKDTKVSCNFFTSDILKKFMFQVI